MGTVNIVDQGTWFLKALADLARSEKKPFNIADYGDHYIISIGDFRYWFEEFNIEKLMDAYVHAKAAFMNGVYSTKDPQP